MNRSSSLYKSSAHLWGYSAPLCNSLCNPVRNPSGPAANHISADDSPTISRPAAAGDFPAPRVPSGSKDAPPGGAPGGAPRPGESTKMHLLHTITDN